MSYRSEVASNFQKLFSGTVVGQAIPLIFTPVLAALYGPEQFGTLAAFLAITSTFAVFSTGRYSLAIMLAESRVEATALLHLCLLVALLVSTALGALLVLMRFLGYRLAFGDIGQFQEWLLPLVVFMLGVLQTFTYWASHHKSYGILSKNRVAYACLVVFFQCLLGALSISLGLVFGYTAGLFVSICLLGYFLGGGPRSEGTTSDRHSFSDVWSLARRHWRFPLVSVWGALANSLAIHMPVLVLTVTQQHAAAGHFGFSFRLLVAPVSLLAASLAHVLHEKFVSLDREKGSLGKYVWSVQKRMLLICIPAAIFLHFCLPELFSVVFSSEWETAGQFASWMVFPLAARCCVSPLSSVLLLQRNIRVGTAWQISYLCTSMLAISSSAAYGAETLVLVYCLHDVVMYAVNGLLINKYSRQ